jgi:hypothetical protein
LEVLFKGRSNIVVGVPSIGEFLAVLVPQFVGVELEYFHHNVGPLPQR